MSNTDTVKKNPPRIDLNINMINKAAAKDDMFKIENICIEHIVPSENNHFNVEDEESEDYHRMIRLAKNINEFGLTHNLVVRKMEDGRYELISGERRYSALKYLVEKEGIKKWAKVPCKVEKDEDDLNNELRLIFANLETRVNTRKEILVSIRKLKRIYLMKRKENEPVFGEKFSGRIRAILADHLNMSNTAVGRYEKVIKALIEEIMILLEDDKINMAVALEICDLSEAQQKNAYDVLLVNKNINADIAKELKDELNEVEDSYNGEIAEAKKDPKLEQAVEEKYEKIISSIKDKYINKKYDSRQKSVKSNALRLNKSLAKLESNITVEDLNNDKELLKSIREAKEMIDRILNKKKQEAL